MTVPVSRSTGWILLCLGLAFATFTVARSVPKLRAHAWPSTTATVVTSSLYGRSGKGHDWCSKVTYAYTVGGRSYQNFRASPSRITSAGCAAERSVVERQLAQLAPGAPLTIYYDPHQPASAARFIDPLDLLDYLCAAFALVILSIGAFYLRYPERAVWQRPAPGVSAAR